MYQTKSFHALTEYEIAQIALELWKGGVTNITKEKISYPECVALVREAHSIKYDVAATESTTVAAIRASGNIEMVDPSSIVRY